MHKDYVVALGLYVVATILVALPLFGLVEVALPWPYAVLKLLHIFAVFAVLCVLVGQLIAVHVMDRAGITTRQAIEYLSLLDHTIPIGLVVIGVLGHSMAAQLGPLWETAWLYESAFGLFVYTVAGLVITAIFRRKRFYLEEETMNPMGAYIGSGIGIVFLLYMTATMVFRAVPVESAKPLAPITKHFAGAE